MRCLSVNAMVLVCVFLFFVIIIFFPVDVLLFKLPNINLDALDEMTEFLKVFFAEYIFSF